MAKFDANKVVWSVGEFEAGAAADEVFETLHKYVKEHQPFKFSNVLGLLTSIGGQASNVLKVINFMFSTGSGYRQIIDRVKDLLVMLERDNDWLDQK